MNQNNNLSPIEIKDLVSNHFEEIEKILQDFFINLKNDLQEGDVNNG